MLLDAMFADGDIALLATPAEKVALFTTLSRIPPTDCHNCSSCRYLFRIG
jgi:hypothetical protein